MLFIYVDRMFVLFTVFPPLTGHGRSCRLFHSRFGWRICFNHASVAHPGTLIIHSRGRKVVSSGTYLRTYLWNKVGMLHAVPRIEWDQACSEIIVSNEGLVSTVSSLPCTRASRFRQSIDSREEPPHPQSRGLRSDEPEIVLSASPGESRPRVSLTDQLRESRRAQTLRGLLDRLPLTRGCESCDIM